MAQALELSTLFSSRISQSMSLFGWSQDELIILCVLSGCDYVSSLPGIGLKTAYKYMTKYRRDLLRILKIFQFQNKLSNQFYPIYLKNVKEAINTFKHQTIFSLTSSSNDNCDNCDENSSKKEEEEDEINQPPSSHLTSHDKEEMVDSGKISSQLSSQSIFIHATTKPLTPFTDEEKNEMVDCETENEMTW